VGLRDDIQADLKEAMDDADGLADVVDSFKFVYSTKANDSEYNSETDSYTNTTPAEFPSRGIFNEIESERVNGTTVLHGDEEIVVNGLDVLNFTPLANMIIEKESGEKYRLLEPTKVGGGTAIVWLLQVRIDVQGV
jgi:hypothetical protein